MPTKGEIAVALRLTDEKIASDLNKAMAKMKTQISATAKAMTIGTSGGYVKMEVDTGKASAAVDKHTQKVQKLTSALKEQKKAQQQANSTAEKPEFGIDTGGRPLPKPKIKIEGEVNQGLLKRDARGRFVPGTNKPSEYSQTPSPRYYPPGDIDKPDEIGARIAAARRAEEARKKAARIAQRNKDKHADFLREQEIKRQKTLANPPPILKQPKPVVINSQLLRNVVGAMAGSTLAGPIGAGLGATGMGATGPIGIAIGAATAALAALKTAIMNTVAAYDQARQMYAKQLMSGGMARGFIVRQSQLAEVLGVSENQVMQYGTAIAYLNKRLEFSAQIKTKTNPALTDLSWRFQILHQNMGALWAQMANDAAPAIRKVVDALSKITVNAVKVEARSASVHEQYMAEKEFAKKWNLETRPHEVGKTPFFNPTTGKNDEMAYKEFLREFDKRKKIGAPDVPVSINRLPSSNWEKMGLVLGQGGGNDYQKKTADGVTKTVVLLAKMIAIMHGAKIPLKQLNPQYSQF